MGRGFGEGTRGRGIGGRFEPALGVEGVRIGGPVEGVSVQGDGF